VTASGPIAALLERYRTDLPMLFIVSDVALNVGASDGPDQVSVEVEKAPGVKCDRCWRYVPSTRSEPEWAGICDRCVEALAEPVNR
jgi:isoleucyl-tRNA synthetase